MLLSYVTIIFYICFPKVNSCPNDLLEQQFPQFQVIAAAKTGSTSLYSYLCQLPSIECLAKKKELNLLRNHMSVQDEKGKKRALDGYIRNGFNVDSEIRRPFITFEASIHYYHNVIARDNLRALLPCSKLVWVLRNPLPRAISEYLHQAVKNKNYPTFKNLISAEVAAVRKCRKGGKVDFQQGFDSGMFKCLATFKLKKYMLSTAFYGYFITAWLDKFPREQQLFLDYENFKVNPDQTVEKISNFLHLEVPPLLNRTWKYNKANTRDGIAVRKRDEIDISPKFMTSLVKEILPFINPMYEIIGEDFKWKLDSLN